MSRPIHILGFAGSLRRGSYNRAALRAASGLLPADATLEVVELDGIPPFNEDLEKDPPPEVIYLKQKIRDADAVLIATPEYNYSIPGMLKNAIDWSSRPHGDPTWYGKPTAIMGASPGAFGTTHAQHHLRQVFVTLNVLPINKPEVLIAHATTRFDAEGNLTDDKTRELISQLLKSLVEWTRRIGIPQA